MTRSVLCLLFVTACWTGAEPAAAPATPTLPADPRAEVREGECIVFEAMNPRCKHTCLPGAPDSWPGCVAARDRLVAQGYTCTTTHPRSCAIPLRPPLPPPGPACLTCYPLVGRIIQMTMQGSKFVITIARGSAQGVTPALQATLGTDPVTIIRIDQNTSTGTIPASTPGLTQQLNANPYVTFQP